MIEMDIYGRTPLQQHQKLSLILKDLADERLLSKHGLCPQSRDRISPEETLPMLEILMEVVISLDRLVKADLIYTVTPQES